MENKIIYKDCFIEEEICYTPFFITKMNKKYPRKIMCGHCFKQYDTKLSDKGMKMYSCIYHCKILMCKTCFNSHIAQKTNKTQ